MKISQDNYYVKGMHKVIIKIKLLTIPRIPEGHSPIIWVELYSGTEKVTSTHYPIANILEE